MKHKARLLVDLQSGLSDEMLQDLQDLLLGPFMHSLQPLEHQGLSRGGGDAL